MKKSAEVIREFGPFTGVDTIHGLTYDGQNVWFASGDKLNCVDPDTGTTLRSIDIEADAGTAFDGKHIFQIAGDRIQKVDPSNGQVLSVVPAPPGANSGLAWAEGFLWVGQYHERRIHQIDPGIATYAESTMTDTINNSQSAYLHRSSAWLVGGFAVLALLLGVVGLYGVVAYSVSQRTREIGVRMAVGAERTSVYLLVLKQAGKLTVIGIMTGLICSVGAAMLMRKLLFGTQAWDAATLASVAVILAVSAMLASYLPAHRAASVNPADALRAE